MQSKLTLVGLYNYDNTALDNLKFPEGIDRDTAISTIILRCGEFELLYPSLPFVKSLCDVWSKKHYRTFEKWINALNIEYNPLDNYDRHEEYKDIRNGSSKTNGVGTNNGKDITDSSSSTTGSTSPAQTTTTDTKSVSAFDASGYSPKEQNVSKFELNVAGSDSSTITGSGTTTHDSKSTNDETSTHDETITHDAHLYGNIGVTTSQEMLRSELDIARFNIYDQIADIFCEEFCLMIY